MLEKAFKGSSRYWGLVGFLIVLAAVGVITYLRQFSQGLTITGLSRDVPWGLYIAQLTFMVGVAASAVMVVLPYYLHDYKKFGKIVILGECLAISAVIMCMAFVFVDMGQPMRVLNIALHPTLNSPMFWDMVSLGGYLVLNAVIAYVTFGAEKKGVAPPQWIRPVIIVSIPWAVSIHTVTAFLYCGLEARHFWLTAILAPRFLASAFAAGPSILIIMCLIIRKYTRFDAGDEAIGKLGQIVTYAMAVNIFFVGLELFTGLYSDIPSHVHHFEYLYLGYHGHNALAPWMWASSAIGIVALIMLLFPGIRRNTSLLAVACVGVVVSLWIEKGLGMVIAGFVPNPLMHVTEYHPTAPEIAITLGVYGLGFLILTILYKVAVTVREELEA